ncbi:MAG: DUF2169 domain-containing protein [Deltaproteobacteria bacterium]|nr:DUF2169 domain-containing protein [Deltaproteobacteria bacterium]
MEFQNNTPFPSALFRGCIDGHRLYGSVVARLTYDLHGDRLVLAAEQSWQVSPGPWQGPCGPMEGDELFYRGGVDLFVFGSARPPGGKPAPAVDVTAHAGPNFSTSIRVFGDRCWEKRNGRLIMSPPEPFEAVPLTVANAYGGADEWDEMAIPFPGNPAGKGYVIAAENAPGKLLPNIEDPNHLIERWEDQPDPVGVCPCPVNCGQRIAGRFIFNDRTGALQELKPTFFNHAFPKMIAPFLESGVGIRVTGVRPEGPLQFTLQPPPFAVCVRIGRQTDKRCPPVDQIALDVERQQVILTYRYPFRYVMTPLELRSCELLPAE